MNIVPKISTLPPLARQLLLWGLAFGWLLWVTGYWSPQAWRAYGNGDYDLTYATLEAPRRAILEYGQFPQYNPYTAAGTDLIANPQSVHLGIFFLPTLLFGSFFGFKVAILLGYALGLGGGYWLLRQMGLPIVAALGGGMLWVSTGFFAWHILYAGHLNALYLFLLPYLMLPLANFVRQQGRLSIGGWLLSVGVWLQLVLGGTTYILIYTALFWAGIVAVLVWQYRTQIALKQWIRYGLLTFGVAVGSSLWKLYPAWEYMQDFPRTFHDTTRVSVVGWLQMLAGTMPTNANHSLTYWGWHEHAIGGGLVALVVLVAYARELKSVFGQPMRPWWLLLGGMIWFSMGNTPNYANPWYVLNTFVPVFDNLRVPYRAAIFPVLLATFGFLIIYYKKYYENTLWSILLAILVLFQSLQTVSISANYLQSKPIAEMSTPPKKQAHFAQMVLADSLVKDKPNAATNMYLYLKNNIAVANSYEPLPVPKADSTLFNQFIQKGGKLTSFSPNYWTFSHCKDTLLLGQRYYRGWEIAAGSGRIVSIRGLLAVVRPSAELSLRYTNPHLRTGLALSAPWWLLILALLGYTLWQKRLSPAKAPIFVV